VTPLYGWLQANWFNLVQTRSIVIGLLFAGLSVHRETRTRRLTNLLALKQEHRELWSTIHSHPELARILKSDVDLVGEPVSPEEEIFLRQIIVHIATAWELIRDGTPLNKEALSSDVRSFLSLPVPNWAWQRAAHAQDRDFMNFVRSALKNNGKDD
jgi:hypothetical protein